MPRIARIAGSFAVVVIAYWGYLLLVAQWVEPSLEAGADQGSLASNGQKLPDLVELQMKQLEGLFPPDAWELKNPKILESDRLKLLLGEYRNLGDGRVELIPCTLVFAYEGPAENEEQRRRQAVILQAPQGAMLQFDQPLDLGRAKMGRLVAGRLYGQVTIRSQWKSPGPEDDLWLLTRDIQLLEQKIFTPQKVEFRWGPHFGSGQGMVIKLQGDSQPGEAKGVGLNVSGVESFELRRLDRLHLQLGKAMPLGQSDGLNDAGAEDAPLEITCRGVFLFDVPHRTATFYDQVSVLKANRFGPADQLLCDSLSLILGNLKRDVPPAEGALPVGEWVAEKLEARGRPAVLTAPSRKLLAQSERFEYDLQQEALVLDGSRDVFLRQGDNEIHAKSIFYQPDKAGQLGRAAAKGPGRLSGAFAEGDTRRLEAVWYGRLRLYPYQQQHVVSLEGEAELKLPEVGQLQAGEIHLWLSPPTPPMQATPQPDRLLAQRNVCFNSSRLSGKVGQLEVWFQPMPDNHETAGPGDNPLGGQETVIRSLPQSQTDLPGVESLPGAAASSPAAQRFEISGNLLRARVSLSNGNAGLSHLLVEGEARFVETQTSRPDELPLVIQGDRLEAGTVEGGKAKLKVTGRPAHCSGRGLNLSGANVNLDCAANRLWVEGPGKMDFPVSGDSSQPFLSSDAGRLTIEWQRGLEFDGRQARFEEKVAAATLRQQLHTDIMEVKLRERLDFSGMGPANATQVEDLRCRGGVLLENRSFEAPAQLAAFDRLQVADLAVNLPSGALTAGGPGWLNSVRLGGKSPSGGVLPNSPKPATGGNSLSLMCLTVRFQKAIVGNLHRRQMTFEDQVRTSYAPVDDWQAMLATDDPDRLGPQGVTLRCDRLSVTEMPLPRGGGRALEFEALGNTVVENAAYTARGHRITYTEAKDLLVLEGDGRNDAELFRQILPGAAASRAAAQRILYWPKTNRLKVEDARSLEIGQFSNGKGTK